jgi:hypothetical protein
MTRRAVGVPLARRSGGPSKAGRRPLGTEEVCLNADAPDRVTARQTAVVQQTVIDHSAAPYPPATSGLALPAEPAGPAGWVG